MKNERKVSKEEFENFLKNYHGKLACDTCGISEPPVTTYNDFSRGDYPNSVVARYFKNDMNPERYGTEFNGYILEDD